jgi:hypothetical protein
MLTSRAAVSMLLTLCASTVALPASAQHLPMPVQNQSAEGTVVRKKMPDLTAEPTPAPKQSRKKPTHVATPRAGASSPAHS